MVQHVLGWIAVLAALSNGGEALAQPNVQLEIEIAPTKQTWQPRETIDGVVRWKNVSEEPVQIYPHPVFVIEIVDSEGERLPRFKEKMYLCSNFHRRPEIVVEPGETSETRFHIDTDPLGMIGGFRVTEGRCKLVLSERRWIRKLEIKAPPVPIEIRRAPGQDLSPRIVNFAVGGNRLIVVRENGRVEAFDLDTEERVATLRIKDYAPRSPWDSPEVLSPDGLWLASTQARRGKPVEIHRLVQEPPAPIVVQVPDNIGRYVSWRLARFRNDSRSMYLMSERHVFEFECETGKATVSPEISRWARVSPDGQYFVALPHGELPLRIYSRNEPSAPVTVESSRTDGPWSFFVGNQGVYLRWKRGEDTVLYGYDGKKRHVFPASAGGAYSDSPVGSLILFSLGPLSLGRGSDEIAVWDAGSARLLWRLPDDKHRTPAFTPDGGRLVCGARGESDGVPVLTNAFEVFEAETGRLIKTVTLPSPDEDPK